MINWTPGQPQCDNLWECSELLSEARGEVCLQAVTDYECHNCNIALSMCQCHVNTRPVAEIVWMSHFPHLINKNGKQLKPDNLG